MSLILGNIPQTKWQGRGNNRFVPVGVNVGIGVENPAALLHLENLLSNANIRINKDGAFSSSLAFYSDGVLNGLITLATDEKMHITAVTAKDLSLRTTNVDRLIVSASGTIYFPTADRGLISGSMGQDDVPTTVTILVVNTDYIVDGMTEMFSNAMTFQNNQEEKVLIAGRYFVVWSLSIEVAVGNKETEGAVSINGVRQSLTAAHRTIANANDQGNMGGCGIIDCAVNDLVQIVVRNETDTQDIIVQHANMAIFQIAGT